MQIEYTNGRNRWNKIMVAVMDLHGFLSCEKKRYTTILKVDRIVYVTYNFHYLQ